MDLIGNSLEIKVSIECEGQDLLITITDDGAGMTEEAIRELHDTLNQIHPTKGYGIRNVQQRIRILYGEEYGIHINSKIDEGTTVVIRLPKKTKSK